MRIRGLRLPLKREPDPVLTEEELRYVASVVRRRRLEIAAEREQHLVSESVIREQMALADVALKIRWY